MVLIHEKQLVAFELIVAGLYSCIDDGVGEELAKRIIGLGARN